MMWELTKIIIICINALVFVIDNWRVPWYLCILCSASLITNPFYTANIIQPAGWYNRLSAVEEVLKKFDKFDDATMKTYLGKVDPPLIVDLILRQKREEESNIHSWGLLLKAKPEYWGNQK